MSDSGGIAGRKAQHLEICLDTHRDHVETARTRLDEANLVHRALPEVDAEAVDTSFSFLGHTCRMPLFISSMTGGSSEGYRTNKDLAAVAAELGIPVGMGSIRILLRKPEVMDDFRLKDFAPSVPVFANIGGVQLPRVAHEEIYRLIDTLRVDGIAVHLNPGQELFQPGGDRDFRGILEALRAFTARCPVPVIVKETGFGINPEEVETLLEAGAAWVDIAGAGGTNWVRVEAYRLEDHVPAEAAAEFDYWGTPTALLLAALGRDRQGILASGGIRTGMDVVRCLALGAEAAGIALPFVRALRSGGIEEALRYGRTLELVIRTATALAGCTATKQLRRAPLRLSTALREDARELRGALFPEGEVRG
ncbi:MAG: type 2 isopentenyl-diphosphate Delta-isomerase [Spirochaetaceae bacterium]|nr:MAG: type 2 isopentenyl-diphosphate Delta-isomerase [Spirochaetaceae bacterium]